MADRPAPPASTASHAAHDLLLVAALADRDLPEADADHVRARAQVDACAECAALHADLVGLARATHDLPPVRRPRDFALRPADAQRFRPTLVRRILGSFGTARDGFSRPLAMGLTTLGLAGLLVGIVPGALSGGGDAALAPGAAGTGAAPAASAAATAEPPSVAGELEQAVASEQPQLFGADQNRTAARGSRAPYEQPLVLVSAALLVVGLGLTAARLAVRRSTREP